MDSVDKKRDILITNQYPCEGRIMVIEISLEKDSVDKRDIFITNQYPCEGRIMVIKTSLKKTFFISVRPFLMKVLTKDTYFKVGKPWSC